MALNTFYNECNSSLTQTGDVQVYNVQMLRDMLSSDIRVTSQTAMPPKEWSLGNGTETPFFLKLFLGDGRFCLTLLGWC